MEKIYSVIVSTAKELNRRKPCSVKFNEIRLSAMNIEQMFQSLDKIKGVGDASNNQ